MSKTITETVLKFLEIGPYSKPVEEPEVEPISDKRFMLMVTVGIVGIVGTKIITSLLH